MIDRKNVSLIIFNMQRELIPLLHDCYQLTHGCRWVADLFQTHKLPTLLIEHKKLGVLSSSVHNVAKDAVTMEKHHFNIAHEQKIMKYIERINRSQVVLAGAESHVCIYQSAMALKKLGKQVFVLADTISARAQNDHLMAIERLRGHHFELISKEMLFFELIDHSESPDYLELAMKFLDGRYVD